MGIDMGVRTLATLSDGTVIENPRALSNDGIRWYAAIGVDTKTAPPPKRQGEAVGIDMGVRTLATLSDGTVIENPRWHLRFRLCGVWTRR